MVALIPFSYFDIFGVRVIGLCLFLFVALFFLSPKFSISVDNNVWLFLLPFFMVLSFSLASGSKDFLSAIVFFVYLLIFYFFDVSKLSAVVNKSCFVYLYGAVFMAVGVILQRISFEKFGYEFGKIDVYGGGRVGFGFLWMDYSFLSLYLVSTLPLVFYLYRSVCVKAIVVIILLVGSVVTTARTGLAALVLTTVFIAGLEFAKAIVIGKARKQVFLVLLSLLFASLLIIYFYVEFSSRTIRFDSSGRIDGFYLGFKSFLDNPFTGVMFDRSYFLEEYGTIPHNLLVYILSQGGILLFIVFFIWFFYVFFVAAFRVNLFRYPIIISVFGFMFIPSFFSAYYFALLISFSMAEKRIMAKGLGQK
ncbi:MAG: hypothetical protein HUJ14_02610 [Marinobacter sp.]|nr:hypothetical protein [Marinobacter sp.]